MAVRDGFKLTEVGEIPEDWEVIPLLEVIIGKPQYGLNAPALPYSPVLPLYLRITDISDEGKFIDNDICSIYEINSNKYLLKHGDIVFARTGASVGKSYLFNLNKKTVFAGYLLKISPNPTLINSYLLWVQTRTERYKKWVIENSLRSGQPGLNSLQLSTYNIVIPKNKNEQTAIAAALSDADSLISSLEQLIAKKRLVKQGAMQELLTGKKRLPGCEGEWEIKKLHEVVNVLDNMRIPISETNRKKGDTPYYGANGILDYVNGYTHDGEFVLLAEDGANDLLNYPVVHAKGRIWVNNHAHVLEAKNNIIDTLYLLYRLQNLDYTQVLVGGTRSKLNKSVLLNLQIILPSYHEQTAIAVILSDMDEEILALEAKLEKARKIKEGMMAELLTGRIRLV